MECSCCLTPIELADDLIVCRQCKNQYRKSCVLISIADPSSIDADYLSTWTCPTCRPKVKDSTPVGSSRRRPERDNITLRAKNLSQLDISAPGLNMEKAPEQQKDEPPLTASEVKRIIKAEIHELTLNLNQTLATYLKKELETFKEDIKQMKDSVTFMSEQYEDFKSTVTANTNALAELRKENDHLKTTVADMTLRMNLMEQQARSSNVEIQCLPEHRGENLVNTVVNLGKVISSNITEHNIHHVTRIVKQNSSSARPKSIVVQFNSPRVRDEFLAASIKFNKNKEPEDKLNSSLLGIGGKKESIYIVEHLSAANKALHAAARVKGKELGYKYVWVRNGRVFMRKEDGSNYLYVKDSDTLNRLT